MVTSGGISHRIQFIGLLRNLERRTEEVRLVAEQVAVVVLSK